MRIKFFCVFIGSVFCINIYAQDTLTQQQAQNIETAQNFKNGQKFKVFVLKDSSALLIGDTLSIGDMASNTSTTSNLLGTTMTRNVYTTVWAGTFSDNVKYGIHPLQQGWKGRKFVIQEIEVRHTGLSKKSQVAVYATAKTVGDPKTLYTLSLDYGIESGEVINPKGKMTKPVALGKLKEAKELLDLGLLNQSQYDSLKNILSPIILNQ